MSEAWSQLRDIDRLADGRVDLDFAIPLSAFPRLPPQPAGSGAAIEGLAQFRREEGLAVAELTVRGSVQLTCQRCLGPMQQPVEGHARIALVASDAEADRVPPQFEPVRASEGRLRLRDLVEEEVLLALPIVPLHESIEDCAPQAQAALAPEALAPEADGTQRPFAGLSELLKR